MERVGVYRIAVGVSASATLRPECCSLLAFRAVKSPFRAS